MIHEIELTPDQRKSIITVIKDVHTLAGKFSESGLNMARVIEAARKDLDEHTINFLIAAGLAWVEEDVLEMIRSEVNESLQ